MEYKGYKIKVVKGGTKWFANARNDKHIIISEHLAPPSKAVASVKSKIDEYLAELEQELKDA